MANSTVDAEPTDQASDLLADYGTRAVPIHPEHEESLRTKDYSTYGGYAGEANSSSLALNS